MGYQQPLAGFGDQSPLQLMMVGQTTTLEPDFPNGGPPTLQVRGLNVLHRFRKKQHTWAWEDTRDSEIAQELGRLPVSDNRPGLGIEVRLGDQDPADEPQEPFVFMNNEYDILFLLGRARRHGYTVYLGEEQKSGKTKQFLYFGSSDLDTYNTYKLEWGKSLTQFRPTLTTANQVDSVTVLGWDRRAKRAIQGTAKWGEPGLKINLDQQAVARAVEGRQEVITDKPVYTRQQANAMAKDILRNQLKEMIKASGGTVGLPDLRAGRVVQIGGLGERFNGTYFVTDTTHTIGNDGYRTTFNARREQESKQ
jgi:phage protein D